MEVEVVNLVIGLVVAVELEDLENLKPHLFQVVGQQVLWSLLVVL